MNGIVVFSPGNCPRRSAAEKILGRKGLGVERDFSCFAH